MHFTYIFFPLLSKQLQPVGTTNLGISEWKLLVRLQRPTARQGHYPTNSLQTDKKKYYTRIPPVHTNIEAIHGSAHLDKVSWIAILNN